jgi:hypothetical protein
MMAYIPIHRMTASAPAPGNTMSRRPNSTDAAPPAISSHSPVITRRRRIAVAISETPVTIAQAAMR